MRELKIVGLDLDGKHIICEGDNPADKFKIRVDDRLRAALRGDGARVAQTHIDIEVTNMLSPKEIQARIRSGASVEQLAEANGVDIARVERFAHPVLLERSRAAELATAAHPVLTDGPAVLTLLETVTSALVARGLNPDNCSWDAWRNEDGRWTVQLGWKAGRSDNIAHFRFCPGAHGGTVTAVDDAASELIDPNFDRPLRPVAVVAQLDFDDPVPAPPEPVQTPEPEPKAEPTARARRGKPAVPAWEDVLLGVRSSGQR
ncbi:MAG: septation protein SepH [Mycobacterium sp.]